MCFQDIRNQILPKIFESNMKNEAALIKKLTQMDSKKRPSAREI